MRIMACLSLLALNKHSTNVNLTETTLCVKAAAYRGGFGELRKFRHKQCYLKIKKFCFGNYYVKLSVVMKS